MTSIENTIFRHLNRQVFTLQNKVTRTLSILWYALNNDKNVLKFLEFMSYWSTM